MSRASSEGWDTALDAQTDLLRSFGTLEGRKYLSGFVQSLGRAGVFDANTGDIVMGDPEYASMLVHAATTYLADCDPMYVSADLTELVDYAADHKSRRAEPLIVTDLITPSGFAYFSKPLFVTDTRGLQMPFRAIQWNPTTDRTAPGEAVSMAQSGQAYTGVIVTLYAHRGDGDPLDDENRYSDIRVGGSDLVMEYVTTMRFAQESEVYEKDDSIRDMLAHVKTFFRLCQQTIAVPRHERVARPTWKRARATWRDIKEVVVFTLRRAKTPQYEGEQQEVAWSHRWMVNGHWRNQWYPSEKVHRQIWIAPFIKGPDNKPLILKRRAFELIR
jgi:hypothetical protein